MSSLGFGKVTKVSGKVHRRFKKGLGKVESLLLRSLQELVRFQPGGAETITFKNLQALSPIPNPQIPKPQNPVTELWRS